MFLLYRVLVDRSEYVSQNYSYVYKSIIPMYMRITLSRTLIIFQIMIKIYQIYFGDKNKD
jgi:hypothetical protein